MFGFADKHRTKSLLTSPRDVLKYSLVLVLVALPFVVRSDELPADELLRQGDLYLDPGTQQPFSGVAVATFEGESSVIAQRLGLRSNAYDGPFEGLFEDRRLSSKELYENGVRHGSYEWYFESGALFERGTYEQGVLEGPYRAYWDSGELYEEGTYRRGQFDGPRRWYMDDRLVEMVTYRHGMIEGLYERYKEDGSLDLKGMLYAGDPCGTWIEGEHTISYPTCGVRVTE